MWTIDEGWLSSVARKESCSLDDSVYVLMRILSDRMTMDMELAVQRRIYTY
jgi:hypothetical protein